MALTEQPTVSDPAVLARPEGTAIDAARSAAADAPEEYNVTDAEQAEYDRAADALADILFRNDGPSNAVVESLMPDNKVGSAIETANLVLSQLDDRLDLDEEVLAQIAQDTVEQIISMGDAKGIQYTAVDQEQILGGVWEHVMMMVGGEDDSLQEDYDYLVQGMAPNEIQDAAGSYQQLLNQGDGAGEVIRRG